MAGRKKQSHQRLREFSIHGPFTVPIEPNKPCKMVARDLSVFWSKIGSVSARRGVYVFAVKAGKGITPVYVGKAAAQTFKKEAFADHKLARHYNPSLLDYKRGSPIVFFVAHPISKGPVNKVLIDQIESALIEVASIKNPDLSNDLKVPNPKWRIRGMIRGRKGEASRSTRALNLTLGVRKV
jgi:hypothetical protein